MSKSKGVRFAFNVDDGSATGLTSGPWEVKAHGESVYVYSPHWMKDWKVALHADSLWMMEVTEEAVRSGRTVLPPTPDGRGPWKFTPTPIEGGGRFVFALAASRSALLPRERFDGVASVVASARWDALNVASIWMTEPGIEGNFDGLIGAPQTLRNGRRVWVTSEIETWGPEDYTLNYRGSVLEPWRPETHGVSGPGIMIRGATVAHGAQPEGSETDLYGPAVHDVGGVVFQPVDIRDLLDERGELRVTS